MRAVFFQIIQADDKAASLLAAIRAAPGGRNSQRFEVDSGSFAKVPRTPFAYWASEQLRRRFIELPAFESNGRVARQGGVNGDDFRWLHLWFESVPRPESSIWVAIAKGGKFSRFFADLPLVARWDRATGTFAAFTGLPHRPSLQPASFSFYFRPGLTWPLRTNGLSIRALPSGGIFSHKGPAAFVADNRAESLLALASIGNSRAFALLLSLLLARTELAQSFEVGLIQSVPVPNLVLTDESTLAALARRAWALKRSLETRVETSHAFVVPALLQLVGETLGVRSGAWSQHVERVESELAAIQSEIDERCFALYGIDDEDRRAITEGFGGAPGGSESSEEEIEEEDAENEDEAESGADATALASELVSWAVGVAFGRFDVRLATSDRPLPVEPEPFDPLPVCSPGMLTGDDGLPLARPPAGYPLSFPDDGILVDDPGHPRDITAAVRAVFEAVFGSRADAMWQEAATMLEPRDHDLRRWLATGFFEHHLRRHSKSRRKAPILWQLSVPSGRYSVWCYAHKMTRDSLLAIQNDVVAPKLAHEERRLSSLVSQTGQTPSARERAEIATQASVVDELRTLLAEVRRVTPLWNPDLDDGIVLVMAPLWRLVPTHKAWQKELKARWNELAAGKYDWAQLAMHLWPERVVPKCASDRSLAIAHELEDVFWAEGGDGKWTARTRSTRPSAELIADRNSPAAKAALVSLLEASILFAGGGRRAVARPT